RSRGEEKSERTGVRHRHSLDPRGAAVPAVRYRSGRARARPRACAKGVLGQSAGALQGQAGMKIKANGIAFNTEISGPENAPWLIFSNSLATNLHMWGPQAAALNNEFRMLRYDQIGRAHV